jgi:hypothetical protein
MIGMIGMIGMIATADSGIETRSACLAGRSERPPDAL